MTSVHPLFDSVVRGEAESARQLAESALITGTSPERLLNRYLIPAMEEVGLRFERNEYFIPHMLLSARAMKAAMEPLKPALAKQGVEPAGRVVIGTVQGDMHDIGKNLVASMLEGNGFEVVDLGTDVGPERFVSVLKETGASLLAMSALLTTTMITMKDVMNALQESGIRTQVRVMVGGAPVNRNWCSEIGADGYSEDAAGAVRLARNLTGMSRP